MVRAKRLGKRVSQAPLDPLFAKPSFQQASGNGAVRYPRGRRRETEPGLFHPSASRRPLGLKRGCCLSEVVSACDGRQEPGRLALTHSQPLGVLRKCCAGFPSQDLQRHGGGVQHMSRQGVRRVRRVPALGPEETVHH